MEPSAFSTARPDAVLDGAAGQTGMAGVLRFAHTLHCDLTMCPEMTEFAKFGFSLS
jgi:hypothetical protein